MTNDNKEIFKKKIRRIEIWSRKAVNDLFAGEYHSVFKGQGLEFQEVREYQPGDDIRSIDWNVTARLGALFVKRYTEERQRTIMLAVDVSSSGIFGSLRKSKIEIAAEVAAVLSLCAIKNNDRVGLLLFSNKIEKYIPPRKNKQDALVLTREILSSAHTREGITTDFNNALKYLNRIYRKRAIVFLISDFLFADGGGEYPTREYQSIFLTLSKKHDLIPIWIRDKLEQQIPTDARDSVDGLLLINDPESGETAAVDFSNKKIKEKYNRFAAENYTATKKFFNLCGVDFIELSTDENTILKSLNLFFRTRERKLRHHLSQSSTK